VTLLAAPSRWLRCLLRTRTTSSQTLLSPSSPISRTATSRSDVRLHWPNSLQTFRAFFSPSSSPVKSLRCPLPSPSSAGSGRVTPANNENPATPRRPSNRPRLPLQQTRHSPAAEATRIVVAKTQTATTQAPQLLRAMASSPAHSHTGFGQHLPDDRVKPARAGPCLSNLASNKSQQYVIPFIALLGS